MPDEVIVNKSPALQAVFLGDDLGYSPSMGLCRFHGIETVVVRLGDDLVFWNPADGKVVGSIKGAGRKMSEFTVSRNSKMLAVALCNGIDLVGDLPSGKKLLEIPYFYKPPEGYEVDVHDVPAITRSGRFLARDSVKIRCWDVATKKLLWSVAPDDLGLLIGEVGYITPDEKWLIVGRIDDKILVCEIRTGKISTIRVADTGQSLHL